MAAAPAAADVHGDALALAEQLDRALGDPGVELLADQPVRHRVVMPVDVDVVVEPDPPRPPFGILVGLGRQLLQRRLVELEKQVAPADAEAAHRPRIEVGDQLPDRPVQLGQRKEAPVPQPRQYPALDHQNGNLNLRLVARLARAGR